MPDPLDIPAAVRDLARQLAEPRSMRRGSLAVRYMKCNKPGCVCAARPDARHGPYYSVVRVVDGKTCSRHVPAAQGDLLRQQVQAGQQFRQQVESGTLPNGVTFTNNGNGTATLSGTPGASTGGSYPFTITASNGVLPNATQFFTLTVTQAPGITSTNATTFTVVSAGTFAVTTSGFPTIGTITKTASSSLAVSYSLGSLSVCTNVGAALTMVSRTGTCVVQYNQAGNATYLAALQVTNSTTATASAMPDLVVTSVSAPPTGVVFVVPPGWDLSIMDVVNNQGTAAAGTSTTQYSQEHSLGPLLPAGVRR